MPAEDRTRFVRFQSQLVRLLIYAILALVIVIPFHFLVAQPFIVSSTSMEPTFKANQYLVIDRISYRFANPQRGDIVVFHYPLDPSVFYIKRVVGIPGEVVESNGDMVSVHTASSSTHRFLAESLPSVVQKNNKPISVTLAQDEYFVLGDNRDASSDSREWGPLQRKFIIGRVLLQF